MKLSDAKVYFTKTLEALDPRTLREEFSTSNAVWSCNQAGSLIDPYAGFKTYEKVAIIMKPYFKVLGYMALVATIVLASLHLSPLAIVAGLTIVLATILALGATYIADPNYFEPSYVNKFKKWMLN